MAWGLRIRSMLHNRLRGEHLIAGASASLMTAGTEEEFFRVMRDDIAPALGGVANLLARAEHGQWHVPPGYHLSTLLSQRKHGEALDGCNPTNAAFSSGGPLFVRSRREFNSRWPHWSSNFEWTTAEAFGVVPIGTSGSPLVSMGLDYVLDDRPSSAHRELSAALSTLACRALERIRFHRPQAELARSLRMSLVPQLFDPLPGLEAAARYQPALDGLDFGGDWYDAFEMPDGTVALVMGDVQGHDVDAAALMSQVRASIRAFAFVDGDPGTVLKRANDLFCTTTAHRFTSCAFLRYQPSTRTVQAAYAGHMPAAWMSPDGSRGLLEAETGPVLGVLPHASYPVRSVQLDPEAFIILVTDGLVEGPSQSLQHGMRRLGALGAEALANSDDPETIAEALMTAGSTTGHVDDAALLIARTTPRPHGR